MPVAAATACAQRVHQRAGLGEEAFAADRDVEVEPFGVLRQRGAQPGAERGAGVAVVEADVEHARGAGRDDVGGRVADIDAGDLQAGRFEPVAAGVERRGGQRGQRAHQPVHRIVGAVRIGDVALRADAR